MDDFLKSKAMITPGVAGATTTMIAGTLYSQFALPAACRLGGQGSALLHAYPVLYH
jgi:hypothetical protein